MSTRHLTPEAGSTFIAVDAEGALGGHRAAAEAITGLIAALRQRFLSNPASQLWIGSGRPLAERMWFELPTTQTHFVVGMGRAGGRIALLEAIDVRWLAGHYAELVVVSPSPRFVAPLREARSLGMRTHVVHGVHRAHQVVLDLADEVTAFRVVDDATHRSAA